MTSGITRLVFLLQLLVCHYLHTDQALQQLSLYVHSRALRTGSLCFVITCKRLKTLVLTDLRAVLECDIRNTVLPSSANDDRHLTTNPDAEAAKSAYCQLHQETYALCRLS
jgi:hypothetical protein